MADLPAKLTNTLYGVEREVRYFEEEHAGERVLAAGASKAIHSYDPIPVGRGVHWATARRGVVLATTDRLVCGDWDIPYDRIERAELLRTETLLSQGLILRVSTVDGHHYQFGLQHDSAWGSLPLAMDESDAKLGYTPLSLVLRLLVAGALLYWAGRALLG